MLNDIKKYLQKQPGMNIASAQKAYEKALRELAKAEQRLRTAQTVDQQATDLYQQIQNLKAEGWQCRNGHEVFLDYSDNYRSRARAHHLDFVVVPPGTPQITHGYIQGPKKAPYVFVEAAEEGPNVRIEEYENSTTKEYYVVEFYAASSEAAAWLKALAALKPRKEEQKKTD